MITGKEFRDFCAEVSAKKKQIIDDGGSYCTDCQGNGSVQEKRRVVLFGCKTCKGIGAVKEATPCPQ